MFERKEPRLTELMRRILNAGTNTGRIIRDWVRDEKGRRDESVLGKHVLG